MDTKELCDEVSNVYALISQLRVSGDAVDLIAAAREKLRRLDKGIRDFGKKEAAEDGGQVDSGASGEED